MTVILDGDLALKEVGKQLGIVPSEDKRHVILRATIHVHRGWCVEIEDPHDYYYANHLADLGGSGSFVALDHLIKKLTQMRDEGLVRERSRSERIATALQKRRSQFNSGLDLKGRQ
jgi:hypothetical protein